MDWQSYYMTAKSESWPIAIWIYLPIELHQKVTQMTNVISFFLVFIFVALTGFYTRKADVFSFGTTIWEIVYRGTKVPYADILLRDNMRLSTLLPRIYRDKLTPELPQVPLNFLLHFPYSYMTYKECRISQIP